MFTIPFITLVLMGISSAYGRVLSESELDASAKHGALIATAQRKTGDDVLVVDYDKSMTGIYSSEADGCFLIGGVDRSVDYQEKLALQEGEKVYYDMANDYPVTDKSLLPSALQQRCSGKQVEWLERHIGDVPRRKRSTEGKLSKECLVCVFWFCFFC